MAARYWVGGTASWDGTAGTKWAATDGGAGGQTVPTTADDVYFTPSSGTNTVTIATGNTGAKSITCTGFTGTLAGSAAITVAGSVTLDAGMTHSYTGTMTITGTGTITSAGKTLCNSLVISTGVIAVVTLGDALTTATNAGGLTITTGTFTTNNNNVTVLGLFSSGSGTRALNLGSSTVTVTGGPATNALSVSSTLSLNAGTSTIVMSGDGGFSGGGLTFYNVSFTGASGFSGNFTSISGTNTFNNFSVTALSSSTKVIQFAATQTINGTFSTSGTAGNSRIFFRSNSISTTRTITVNSTPSLLDADFQDITISGTAAPISGTRLGDRGNNSGITFPAAKTVYWNLVGGGSWNSNAWAVTSGGTVSTDNFPLAQDTAIIENTGLNTSATISTVDLYGISTVDMSTRTNAATISIGNTYAYVYGNWINGSGTTISGTGNLDFDNASTQTITSAGKTFSCNIQVTNVATVKLLDNLTITTTKGFYLNLGTLNLNNLTLATGIFSSDNSSTRTIAFGTSGKIQLTSVTTSTTILAMGSTFGFSYTGTPSIEVTGSLASGTRFLSIGANSGGSESTAMPITVGSSAGAGTLSFGGHFKTLNFTGFTGVWAVNTTYLYNDLIISTGMTLNAGTSLLLFYGSSGTQKVTTSGKTFDFPVTVQTTGSTVALQDNWTVGSTRLFTLTSGTLDLTGNSGNWTLTTGSFNASGTSSRTIAFGTGQIALSGNSATILSITSSTNLSTTGTVYINSTYSGGLSRTFNITFTEAECLASYNVSTTGTSGIVLGTSSTGSLALSGTYGSINLANFVGLLSVDNRTIYGDLTLPTTFGTLATGSNYTIFAATSGTQTITSNGNTTTFPINIVAPGATVKLADDFICSSSVLLNSGTFDANNKNVTASVFSSSGTNTRTITMGSGTWTLSGIRQVWNTTITTGLTFNKNTANIVLSDTSTSSRYFNGGGLTFNNLTIGGSTGVSTTTFGGGNTFGTLSSTKTVAHTILLESGKTTTVSDWTINGTSGNIVTLSSLFWSQQSIGTTDNLNDIAWGSGVFAATNSSNGNIYTSSNGITWVSNSTSAASNTITSSGSLFVAAGNLGAIQTSPDGTTWTTRTPAAANSFRASTWGNGLFVLGDGSGYIQTSPTGVTWTTRSTSPATAINGIVWGGSNFVAVGNTGTARTSPDGITWTTQSTGVTNTLYAVASSGTLFVAVGASGTIITSPDGVTWTPRTSGVSTGLSITDVIWANNQFTAIAGLGTIVTSSDGITWNLQESGTTMSFTGISWSGNTYAIVSTGGNVFTNTPSAAQHTLSKSGGGTISVNYMDISYSNATPLNTWNALKTNGNINSGNNTGWNFGPIPNAFFAFY